MHTDSKINSLNRKFKHRPMSGAVKIRTINLEDNSSDEDEEHDPKSATIRDDDSMFKFQTFESHGNDDDLDEDMIEEQEDSDDPDPDDLDDYPGSRPLTPENKKSDGKIVKIILAIKFTFRPKR